MEQLVSFGDLRTSGWLVEAVGVGYVRAGYQALGLDRAAGWGHGVRALGERADHLRRYRPVTINTGNHTMTADDLLPDDIQRLLATVPGRNAH